MTSRIFGLPFRRFCRCTGLKFVLRLRLRKPSQKSPSIHSIFLISDLNIGEPGDGFTVVSAMRRTQPDCINFILTGFPAFESALAAIQRQVDGFLVKPAKIEELVCMIEEKLLQRTGQPRRHVTLVRLSNLMRERVDEICNTTLAKMKSDPVLGCIAMSDRGARRLSAQPSA